MKKIDLYINGKYICTSTKYKTCKEFKEKVLKDGFICWASVHENKVLKLKESDKIICCFQKQPLTNNKQ